MQSGFIILAILLNTEENFKFLMILERFSDANFHMDYDHQHRPSSAFFA